MLLLHTWEIETIYHLFNSSKLAQAMWSHFGKFFEVGPILSLNWREKCKVWWSKTQGCSQDLILAGTIPSFILWKLWLARNDMIYAEKKSNIDIKYQNSGEMVK